VARRICLSLFLTLSALLAQQQPPVAQEPPEEDAALIDKKEYSFNPLQAEKELKTGDFYAKKGNHKAAALRYQEATKWNPGLADAWLKLGEALEKRKDTKGAREAFAKYLELAPDAKNAAAIRKKL
jgi:tetratricopeptide (TPR) repeat protein